MGHIALTTRTAAGALPAAIAARIADAFAASRSAATLRAYAGAFRRFAAWAGGHGLAALPAEPATVAGYYTALADLGKSVATVRMAAAAIGHAHRTAGERNPARHEVSRRTLAGIARQAAAAGRTGRQARGLTGRDLTAILAVMRAGLPTASRAACHRRSHRHASVHQSS